MVQISFSILYFGGAGFGLWVLGLIVAAFGLSLLGFNIGNLVYIYLVRYNIINSKESHILALEKYLPWLVGLSLLAILQFQVFFNFLSVSPTISEVINLTGPILFLFAVISVIVNYAYDYAINKNASWLVAIIGVIALAFAKYLHGIDIPDTIPRPEIWLGILGVLLIITAIISTDDALVSPAD